MAFGWCFFWHFSHVCFRWYSQIIHSSVIDYRLLKTSHTFHKIQMQLLIILGHGTYVPKQNIKDGPKNITKQRSLLRQILNMLSFRNVCITWQKDWRGVHQSNSQRNMQRMVCGFNPVSLIFWPENSDIFPSWVQTPELIGVCSDSTISSEIWAMEDKRIPRFQRKYLWKFQTCSFVGIPMPKTSENQPRVQTLGGWIALKRWKLLKSNLLWIQKSLKPKRTGN